MERGGWTHLGEPLGYPIAGPSQSYPHQGYQEHPPPNYSYKQELHRLVHPPPHPDDRYSLEDPFHNFVSQYHRSDQQYPDDVLFHPPYQYKEDEWEEEEELEEEEEDEDFVYPNSIEEALLLFDIHLPRLSATAPPSVIPPKGGGRCLLPSLGRTSNLNAVLQCLYHTPAFANNLSRACEELQEEQKQRSLVARALIFLMNRMDDVKIIKRGIMAYLKGIFGFRDEAFTNLEHQGAYDLVVSLLHWLHQDLSSVEKKDCACWKVAQKKYLVIPASRNTSGIQHQVSIRNSTTQHLQQQRQLSNHHHQPSDANHHLPQYTIYTGENRHQKALTDSYQGHNQRHHHNQNSSFKYHEQLSTNQTSNSALKSNSQGSKGEKKVCQTCGVTFQRSSMVSDVFEGINQVDVICAKVGIILHTTYQRFTTISAALNTSGKATLEEALRQYYGINMVMWNCKYCNKSHLCHQQIRLLCSPRVLIIHISRATDRHNSRTSSIDFPIDHLTLQSHMVAWKKNRSRFNKYYSVYAVCNRHGTGTQGRYTASCRANKTQTEDGTWFLFETKKIKKSRHLINTKDAHILFYKERNMEMES